MIDKTWTFRIDQADELAAGLRGFTDTVTINVDSGDPCGEDDEFGSFMRESLKEWYDGASVTCVSIKSLP